MRSPEIRTFVAYCWTTWGTATADTVRSNGDSLLVGAAVSVEAAGIYNVAKQLAGILRKLNTVYASAAFPEISSLSAHGEEENAALVRRRMLWVGGAIGVVAVAAALVIGRPVIGLLFGPRFEAAWLPLVILTAAAAAQLISHTLSMYVQVYVGPERLFRVYLVAIGIFVIAAFPLTSAFSISGTALAQLLFSLSLIYFCHLALRRTDAA
jgi:O-antigen/teichoic acid export membrane protein